MRSRLSFPLQDGGIRWIPGVTGSQLARTNPQREALHASSSVAIAAPRHIHQAVADECVGVAAGRPGFSKLDTAARDAELARREAGIRSIETELERRRISARRDEADAALAALVGGEAA